MITFHLKPKHRVEGTEYDRLTEYASVSVADNGLEFYETDTGILYTVAAGAWLAINVSGGGGATTFLELSDTPSSYSGSTEYFVSVNVSETAIVFRPLSDIAGNGMLELEGQLIIAQGDGINSLADSIEVDVTDLIGAGLVEIATNNIGLGTPSSLTAITTNTVTTTSHTHVIDSTIARSAITIGASGLGLSGGGDLTANRTITLASSAAGAADAHILATDASGNTSLQSGLTFNAAATISTTSGLLVLNSAAGVVINETGADVDFRVEGVGQVNALFVQGSDGFVGIGNGTPSYPLDIAGTGELLRVGSGTGEADIVFNGAAGSVRDLRFQTGGVNRWLFRVNGTAESGANAGSDFSIVSRDDAGGIIGFPLFIRRSNGQVGINTVSPAAQLSVDQSSTTGAIAAVDLDQADLSEEFINFISTIGAGNPIDTAAIGTYYGKVRVAVNGTFKFLALYNS